MSRTRDESKRRCENNKRATEQILNHGDRITIGDSVFLIERSVSTVAPAAILSDPDSEFSTTAAVKMDSTVLIKPGTLTEQFAQVQENFFSLLNFIQQISSILELERLTQVALAEMIRILRADRGTILLLNKADELQPKAIHHTLTNNHQRSVPYGTYARLMTMKIQQEMIFLGALCCCC